MFSAFARTQKSSRSKFVGQQCFFVKTFLQNKDSCSNVRVLFYVYFWVAPGIQSIGDFHYFGLCKKCRSLNFWFSRLRGAQVGLRPRRAGRSRRLNWFAVLCVILCLRLTADVLVFSITFGFSKKWQNLNFWFSVCLKVKVFHLKLFGAGGCC